MKEQPQDSFAQMLYHQQQIFFLEQKIERLSKQLKFEKLALQRELIKNDLEEVPPDPPKEEQESKKN